MSNPEGNREPLALVLEWIVGLPRQLKRAILVIADAIMLSAALFTAAGLVGGAWQAGLSIPLWLYALIAFVSVPVFARLGLYRAVLRFMGSRAVYAVLLGVCTSGFVLAVLTLSGVHEALTPATLAVFVALASLYVGGTRLLARDLLAQRFAAVERVIIYGAGRSGTSLVASLNVERRYAPVGFVDDDKSLHGAVIRGLRVYPVSALSKLIQRHEVTAILLAVPNVSRRRRRKILDALEPLGVRIQTVPDVSDMVRGNAEVADVREIDASDLLGRDQVPPDTRLFDACIKQKVVMVTGAGGSIGSELCRQIVRLSPARLVLLEMSEVALYQIERELRMVLESEKIKLDLIAVLGNAHHRNRVSEVMRVYEVQSVYHAAAYKHVPIVEQNVIEGVHNNVISTWNMAEAALECNVETFVLISTDKAVNPTNVMGATKRFAELVLQGLNERGGRTRFCMVRFGNVLESSGSVVPLFREQIRRGGPVTVTHRDVIRYFMTIPEAAQLVLQAGSMAKGGDVFVLDMGKPMRIDDLARRMIRLAGLTVRDEANPEGDIEILYTGLRPAEKLFEELLIGSNVSGTEHPMIMRAMEHSLPWTEMHRALTDTLASLAQFDVRGARDLLVEVVREYQPTGEIEDLVWKVRLEAARADAEALANANPKVTSLQSRRGTAAH